jgi:hypothetical protein
MRKVPFLVFTYLLYLLYLLFLCAHLLPSVYCDCHISCCCGLSHVGLRSGSSLLLTVSCTPISSCRSPTWLTVFSRLPQSFVDDAAQYDSSLVINLDTGEWKEPAKVLPSPPRRKTLYVIVCAVNERGRK